MRAPTPTAAEFAVPVRLQLMARVEDCSSRLLLQPSVGGVQTQRAPGVGAGLGNPRHASRRMSSGWTGCRNGWICRSAPASSAGARPWRPGAHGCAIRSSRCRICAAISKPGQALDAGFRRSVDSAHARFQRWGDLLESYSYRGVLKRGFALVTDSAGHAIGSSAEARPGEAVSIEFHDGKVAATVDGATVKPKAGRSTEAKAGPQGRLF